MLTLNKSRTYKKYENAKTDELKHDIIVFHVIYRTIIVMLLVLIGLTFYELNYKNEKIVKETAKPLSLCGELASDNKAIPKLITLGIETLSVSPKMISTVKEEIRHV